jgi:hypothetical protein
MSRDRAEDLAQKTVVVVMEKLKEDYKEKTDQEELVRIGIGILSRLSIGAYRTASRRKEDKAVPLDDIQRASGRPGADEAVARKEMARKLRDAIAQLGERCRKLILGMLAERPTDEIFAELGFASRNAFDLAAMRCRRQLRDILGGRLADYL